MTTRRGFFAAIAALPFVGKLMGGEDIDLSHAHEFDPYTGYVGRGFRVECADIPKITRAAARQGFKPWVMPGKPKPPNGFPEMIQVYSPNGSPALMAWFGYTKQVGDRHYVVAFETNKAKYA